MYPIMEMALVEEGESDGTAYLTRAFIEETDIPTTIAFALQTTTTVIARVLFSILVGPSTFLLLLKVSSKEKSFETRVEAGA